MKRLPVSVPRIDRRRFLAGLGAASALIACGATDGLESQPGDPRLTARPGGTARTLAPGVTRIRANGTDIVAYLAPTSNSRARVPLFVFLHGALRTVEFFVDGLRPLADEFGAMVLAPYAAAGTWDAVHGAFGPDVRGLNAALQWAFGVVPIDASQVVLSGFSDGASYALSLGRANGDLFTRLVGFSPGFVLDVPEVAKPGIAISHGTQDEVLSYANTRDVIVPALRARGYAVDFVTFTGTHAVSLTLARSEFQRFGAP